MAIITSNAAVLSIGGETAVCPKSATLKLDLELKDTQCSAANGWKRSAVGNKSWEMSMNFIMDDGAGLEVSDLTTAWNARSLVAGSLAITGDITATGDGYITNITINAPENVDPIEVSVTLTGDDDLTIS